MMKKGSKFDFLPFLGPQKDPYSSFCSDLQPVLTTDPKSTIKELSGSYWQVRGF